MRRDAKSGFPVFLARHKLFLPGTDALAGKESPFMKHWFRVLLGLLVVALLAGGPPSSTSATAKLNTAISVVVGGKLYRSGQMSLDGLRHTIDEYGIKTVISLRYANNEGAPPPDWKEEEYCKRTAFPLLPRAATRLGTNPDGEIPADKPVGDFLDIMDDPNAYPALIHCFAGKHRTGRFRTIYRMEYQHWSNEDAIKELKALGYTNFDNEEDVQGYLGGMYVLCWQAR